MKKKVKQCKHKFFMFKGVESGHSLFAFFYCEKCGEPKMIEYCYLEGVAEVIIHKVYKTL